MEQNDETEFFPENSVSFSHNSVACAVRTLQFVLFKQALSDSFPRWIAFFGVFSEPLNHRLHGLKDFTDYTRRGGFLAVSMMTAGAKTARIELYGNSIALVGHSLDLSAQLIDPFA